MTIHYTRGVFGSQHERIAEQIGGPHELVSGRVGSARWELEHASLRTQRPGGTWRR